MGREQGGRRKHLFLYVACIFAVSQIAAGCAQLTEKLQITTSLAKARDSMEAGDFRIALAENDKALRQSFPVSRSRVLFQRGLIYSHPKNPERDDTAAMSYFQKVVDEYPSSDLAAAAEILMVLNGRMLNEAEEKKSLIEKVVRMEHMLDGQKRSAGNCREELDIRRGDLETLTSAIDRMEHTLKEQQGAISQYQRLLTGRQEHIDQLNSQIEDLKGQIESLKGQIENFKKIDLNIEQKKQDTKAR